MFCSYNGICLLIDQQQFTYLTNIKKKKKVYSYSRSPEVFIPSIPNPHNSLGCHDPVRQMSPYPDLKLLRQLRLRRNSTFTGFFSR